MAKTDLTAQRLRELLHYDPETGMFTWRVNVHPCGKVGFEAGNISGTYRRISIDGTLFLAHRLAIFYVTGKWPPVATDHINGDPRDNRYLNLRCVSDATNAQNERGPRKTNKSGYLGVHWNKKTKKFEAQIKYNGKIHSLGFFADPAKASEIYILTKRQVHSGCTI
jgi:hypothetical protein